MTVTIDMQSSKDSKPTIGYCDCRIPIVRNDLVNAVFESLANSEPIVGDIKEKVERRATDFGAVGLWRWKADVWKDREHALGQSALTEVYLSAETLIDNLYPELEVRLHR